MGDNYVKRTDETKEAHNHLMQIGKIDSLVNEMIQAKEREIKTMDGIKSPATDRVVISKTNERRDSIVESIYQKILRYEKRINRKIDRLLDMKDDAMKYINQIDDLKERELLIARYINGKSPERIAEERYEDVSSIHSQINKGLRSFYKVWKSPTDSNSQQ